MALSVVFLVLLLKLVPGSSQPRNDIDGRPYVLKGAVDPVHDPSIAREGDTYYLYGTDTGYHAPPFLQFRCSPDLITFQFCGNGIFPTQLPAWVRRAVPGATNIWAPDASFFNGLWHLYYAVSTFGSQTSVIGLVTSPTLNPNNASYAWEDQGLVLASNSSLTYNAIDPNLFLDAKGQPWLTLGSFWDGIQVVQLDATSGKPAVGASIAAIATRPKSVSGAVEASFVVFQNSYYYLFTSWDKCCSGNASTYNVRVGRSAAPAGPYSDASGVALLEGGGTYFVGHRLDGWAAGGGQSVLRQAGPSSGPNTLMVLHAYAASNGDPWAQVIGIDWTTDPSGWPQPV